MNLSVRHFKYFVIDLPCMLFLAQNYMNATVQFYKTKNQTGTSFQTKKKTNQCIYLNGYYPLKNPHRMSQRYEPYLLEQTLKNLKLFSIHHVNALIFPCACFTVWYLKHYNILFTFTYTLSM